MRPTLALLPFEFALLHLCCLIYTRFLSPILSRQHLSIRNESRGAIKNDGDPPRRILFWSRPSKINFFFSAITPRVGRLRESTLCLIEPRNLDTSDGCTIERTW